MYVRIYLYIYVVVFKFSAGLSDLVKAFTSGREK